MSLAISARDLSDVNAAVISAYIDNSPSVTRVAAYISGRAPNTKRKQPREGRFARCAGCVVMLV